jgi:hypothetical protein
MRYEAVRHWWSALNPTAMVVVVAVVTGALHVMLYASQRGLYDPLTRRPALITWWLATAGLFATYAWIVNQCRQPVRSSTFLAVATMTPLVLQLCWVFTAPVLSIDLYSYVADSHSARSGLNPYTHAPRDWENTPFGAELQRHGWRPTHGVTPYGPLWLLLATALDATGRELSDTIVIFKAFLVACNAICALLIAGILREIRANAQLLGSMAFWWNPIAVEIAGEGHNDAVMAVLVLLGLWLTVRKRQHTAGALALTCAVLIKYVPAILVPPFIAYRWRTEPRTRLSGITLWSILSAMLCFLLFAPWWIGWQTFAGVFAGMERKLFAGTSGVLFTMLSHMLGPGPAASVTTLFLSGTLLVTIVVMSLRAINDARLVEACATICLMYVLVATPRFWPWYVILPVALLCATGTRDALLMVAVLTFSARLIAPLNLVYRVNAIDWPTAVWISTLVGVWVPVAWWSFSRICSTRHLSRRFSSCNRSSRASH